MSIQPAPLRPSPPRPSRLAQLRGLGWLLAPLGVALAPAATEGEPPRSILQPAGELAAAAAASPGAGLVTSRAPDVVREQLALPGGTGLVVDAVTPDSPAGRAGLRRHDVLVALDGKPLGTPEALLALVAASAADSPLRLDLRRAGQPLAVSLRVEAVPAAPDRLVPSPAGAAPSAAPPHPHRTPVPPPGARRVGPDAVVLEDRDCRLKVYRDSDTHLSMCDARGWLVFNGPISTPEQRSLIPRRVRDRVERLEMMLDSVAAPPTAAMPAPATAVETVAATPSAVPPLTAAPPAGPTDAPPHAGGDAEPAAEIGRLDVPPIEIR